MGDIFNDLTDDMRMIFQSTYEKGNADSLELALKKLKEFGCSQMQSLKMLMAELNLNIRDADELILNSEAWAPEKANNLKFRNDFKNYLEG